MPFGVRFDAGEVTVVRTNPFVSNGATVSPAEEAGLAANDIIKDINGCRISSISDIVNAVSESDGSPIAMTLKRGQKEIRVNLTPKICDDNHAFRLGVMLKDSSAGIGTVTFIKTDSLVFAGLGHGICDSTSGEVLKIDNGYISHVKISGISKGKVGEPGELRGNLESEKSFPGASVSFFFFTPVTVAPRRLYMMQQLFALTASESSYLRSLFSSTFSPLVSALLMIA